jgi:type IV pilus assembly protein PilC/MSHA biogenesis protein MshG
VPLKDLAFFFRQYATMMEAGVPIVQSLGTLAGQARDPKLRRILSEMRGHVEAGRPSSAGMQRYPEVFSPVIVSLVRAGEEGGFPADALSSAADYLDREIELRNLYRRITFYPKLQVVLSILIILGANMILGFLGSSNRLSSPLTNPVTWVCLGPLIVLLFLFFRVGLANARVRYNYDMITSKIPYLGTTLKQLAMSKFGRAFGALYKGGVSIPQCFRMAADACGNEYLRAEMQGASQALREGAGIAETFRATGAFSPIVLDMVSTGEQTGNLDQMLNKMADFYEDEAATRSTQTAQVVGVILGLAVAIYIAYIVITFYMGYFAGIQQSAG